jgi:hypothetical protein
VDHRLPGIKESEGGGKTAVVHSVQIRGRVATATGQGSAGRVRMVLAETTELDEVTIIVASLGEGQMGARKPEPESGHG